MPCGIPVTVKWNIYIYIGIYYIYMYIHTCVFTLKARVQQLIFRTNWLLTITNVRIKPISGTLQNDCQLALGSWLSHQQDSVTYGISKICLDSCQNALWLSNAVLWQRAEQNLVWILARNMHGVKLTETNTRNEMIFAAKHARYHECQDSERNNTATYSHYMLTFIPTF